MTGYASEPVPTVQFGGREDVLDLGWGHPHPAALPVRQWAEAGRAAMDRYGPAALTYGHSAGPGPLIEWLRHRLGQCDALIPRPDQVFVTAGASHGLDLVSALLCRPGDTVLVDSPTYHLALRVLADREVGLRAAPVDGEGIDPDATGDLIGRVHREGGRVPMVYLVPTFNNPSGRSLSAARRAALVAVARRAGTVLVEDDTYRELAYDGPAPPSLFSLDDSGPVARIGSFAKTVAPGLRLGWVTGSAELVRALRLRGSVDSGGGVNHTTALAMAEFARAGGYERHLSGIRDRYRAQRDALIGAVRRELPDVGYDPPAGGWFLWLCLPQPRGGTALLPHAEAHGMSYLPGTPFFVTGAGHRFLRLSFSLFGPELLAEAVRRLAAAYRSDAFQRDPAAGPDG
ncbi:PLP-dependent aminotransferase family protein [Solwaraspora sp. WMMD1047]|uniref:aminotransferase-like domain-containing protein n=1 Tax=Solwaraspora sp. WMMD1047 TaxID=3016102 RepID=UPI002417AD17|nr:PLP-dependent aminotransferase family protein [Solwaraspora sp. WMMD1047]MDG4830947.1 PLP-dependent aminotransferase family protein [Solwaraspora sp. WMMD1047]